MWLVQLHTEVCWSSWDVCFLLSNQSSRWILSAFEFPHPTVSLSFFLQPANSFATHRRFSGPLAFGLDSCLRRAWAAAACGVRPRGSVERPRFRQDLIRIAGELRELARTGAGLCSGLPGRMLLAADGLRRETGHGEEAERGWTAGEPRQCGNGRAQSEMREARQ